VPISASRTRRNMTSAQRRAVVCKCVFFGLTGMARADWYDDIGYTALVARLQAASLPVPTGAGIRVTQVEALSQGGYLPNTNSGELFGEPVVDMTGSGGFSGHANTVGKIFYGNVSSIAENIAQIHAYESIDWMLDGYLRTTASGGPMDEWVEFGVEPPRVQNHSWVYVTVPDGLDFDGPGPIQPLLPGFTGQQIAIDALRRLDHVLDRDGVVAVVAVNNGSGSSIPNLLGNAYNAIVVGQSNGSSSLGPSTLDVGGRSKPDLVASGDFPGATPLVSRAVPKVASSAALLLETATGDADAERSETIKALLLAGATKDELASWSHTKTQPLDLRYGAGDLNIDNSHAILEAGQQEASESVHVQPTGWDFDTIDSTNPLHYTFDIPHGQVADVLSIAVTWHRQIAIDPGMGALGSALLTPSLANLDLKLYTEEEFTSSTPPPDDRQSTSGIDNVEHIFQHTPWFNGTYTIELTADQTWDFALAWRAQLRTLKPGDVDADFDVDFQDFLLLQAGYGTTSGASWNDGDLDGDGDVDFQDFLLFQYDYWADGDTVSGDSVTQQAAVPEPAGFWLGLLAAICAASAPRVRKRMSRA